MITLINIIFYNNLMNYLFMFLMAQIAFIAMGFLEAYVEGRNCWDKGIN